MFLPLSSNVDVETGYARDTYVLCGTRYACVRQQHSSCLFQSDHFNNFLININTVFNTVNEVCTLLLNQYKFAQCVCIFPFIKFSVFQNHRDEINASQKPRVIHVGVNLL